MLETLDVLLFPGNADTFVEFPEHFLNIFFISSVSQTDSSFSLKEVVFFLKKKKNTLDFCLVNIKEN